MEWKQIECKRTDFGFQFGAATVECLASEERKGISIIGITTSKHSLQIYVTKTGKIRIQSPKNSSFILD